MKVKKLLFSCAVLLIGGLALFTGCRPAGNTYPVAIDTGTEGDVGWLSETVSAPTEARRMYEEARGDGYSGTYLDFLKELGGISDPSAAVNSALRSVVDVYAAFQKKSDNRFEATSSYASIGSGVIYDLDKERGDAYILTNYHIVYNSGSVGTEKIQHISDDISLLLYGEEYSESLISATYVGGAMNYDIAILRVEDSDILRNSDACAVQTADSDAIAVGQAVYAIGNPDNCGISAVSGVVSVDAEYISDITAADGVTALEMLEIRTDAPVNHGNSGGGLFNEDGALIGIVNARSEKDGVEHFGYAIPSDLALAVGQNIIDNSRTNASKGALRATLGVTVQVTASRSRYDEETCRMTVEETVAIQSVQDGGLCDGVLQAGDVIRSLQINEKTPKNITRLHMIGNTLFRVRKGDSLTVVFSRGMETLRATLEFSDDEDFTLFR